MRTRAAMTDPTGGLYAGAAAVMLGA